MTASDILEMSHSSSADFPDEFGRPDFDRQSFYGRINELITNGF